MSKLHNALLWLTVPALFTLRLTATRAAHREQVRTVFIDALSRLMLVAATLWMLVLGNWSTAAVLVGLLAALTLIRALTTAWLIARANAAHR